LAVVLFSDIFKPLMLSSNNKLNSKQLKTLFNLANKLYKVWLFYELGYYDD